MSDPRVAATSLRPQTEEIHCSSAPSSVVTLELRASDSKSLSTAFDVKMRKSAGVWPLMRPRRVASNKDDGENEEDCPVTAIGLLVKPDAD